MTGINLIAVFVFYFGQETTQLKQQFQVHIPKPVTGVIINLRVLLRLVVERGVSIVASFQTNIRCDVEVVFLVLRNKDHHQ